MGRISTITLAFEGHMDVDRIDNTLGMVGFFIAGFACWVLLYFISADFFNLARNGVEASGTVTNYEDVVVRGRRGRSRIVHEHLIAYDGHEQAFRRDDIIPVGTRLNVLYIADSPNIAHVSKNKITLRGMITDFGVAPLMFFLIIGAAFVGIAVFFAKRIIRSSAERKTRPEAVEAPSLLPEEKPDWVGRIGWAALIVTFLAFGYYNNYIAK